MSIQTIQVSCYLIVKSDPAPSGYCKSTSIRVTKGKPDTAKNEVAIALTLQLPAGLFRRPSLKATVTVPEDNAPVEITADVTDNLAAVLREHLGVDVRLSVDAPSREGQPS